MKHHRRDCASPCDLAGSKRARGGNYVIDHFPRIIPSILVTSRTIFPGGDFRSISFFETHIFTRFALNSSSVPLTLPSCRPRVKILTKTKFATNFSTNKYAGNSSYRREINSRKNERFFHVTYVLHIYFAN